MVVIRAKRELWLARHVNAAIMDMNYVHNAGVVKPIEDGRYSKRINLCISNVIFYL
jgi:hypothetical protein